MTVKSGDAMRGVPAFFLRDWGAVRRYGLLRRWGGGWPYACSLGR